MSGTPWHQQSLGITPQQFWRFLKADTRDGHRRTDFDHNSGISTRVSNKQIKIVGAALLDRTQDDDIEYDEAWNAVMEVIL